MLSRTEKAAIDEVPHCAMVAIITIFPSWNIEFSNPDGRAMENMVPIIFPLCLNWRILSNGACSCLFLEAMKRIIAETILEIRVAIPTPKAPMLKTRIKTAFPTTLITFAIMEVHIVVFVFPCTLNIAFKELWDARKGSEIRIGTA